MTSGASTIDAAKLLVRIMARRKRAIANRDLIKIFDREGGGSEFKVALDHALLYGWLTRRGDGLLAGGPTRAGLKAAGLI
jgi:hypothetical protein